MHRVAVVEDEELIRTMLRFNLEKQGYEVEAFVSGEDFLARLDRGRYDAVLLDIRLPGMTGRDVLTRIRAQGVNVPVLMVTAMEDVGTVVATMEGGADDYITKPFHMEELLARVNAVIRRSQGERAIPSHRLLRVGGCEVNLETREAQTLQGRVVLTEKEVALLDFFGRNPHRPLGRTEILEEVWGLDVDPTPRTVDNFVLRLRRLFEEDPESPRHFVTVRTAGYLFEP